MIDRSRRGFTLIEMLIVVVIVAILGAIAYGRLNRPALSALIVPDSVVAPQASGRLVVQVESALGRSKTGVPVVFRVIEGSGTISPEVVETDSAGTAGAQWIAGSVAGLNTFAATVGDSDWDRTQMSVTVRVDPSLAPPSAAPAAPMPGAPGALPPATDTATPPAGGTGSTPPPGTTPRDTAAPESPEADGPADSSLIRVPWSATPLWALKLLEPLTVHAED